MGTRPDARACQKMKTSGVVPGRASPSMLDSDKVPRQLLEEATAAVEVLKRNLDEANAANKRDMETALKSTEWQLRTLQNRCLALDEQLKLALQREHDLRELVADPSAIVSRLREENHDLYAANRDLRDQVAILSQASAMDLTNSEKERLAIDASEALSALRYEFEAQREAQTHMHNTEMQALRHHIAQLEEQLAEARGQTTANAFLQDAATWKERVATSGRRVASPEAQSDEHVVHAGEVCDNRLAADETDLVGREPIHWLSAKNAPTGEQIRWPQESLRAAEKEINQQSRPSEAEVAQLRDEVRRVERDAIKAREQHRHELARVQADNEQLRTSLWQEREKIGRVELEHSQALIGAHDRLHGDASDFADREHNLQREIKRLEAELHQKESSSVPQSLLIESEQNSLRARQELMDDIQRMKQEIQRLEDALSAQLEDFEGKVKDLKRTLEEKDQRLQTLSAQVKTSQEQVLREQKLRRTAEEQVRALASDVSSDRWTHNETGGAKPTRMAQCALDVITKNLENSLEIVAESGNDAQALGLVLIGSLVDIVVPGSPAHACGMIDKLDQLLMVDGHTVTEQSAMAALQGRESAISVVSLVFRKAGKGDVVKVVLPRISVHLMEQRQNLEDRVHYLHQTATQSSGNGSPAAAIITKISDDFALLDRSHCQLHLQLCAQISALLDGLNSLAVRAKTCLLHLDGTHQQVHILKSLSEAELISSLNSTVSDQPRREAVFQKQIQDLNNDLHLMKQELGAAHLQRREDLESLEQIKLQVQKLEDEIAEREISQDLLKGALSRLDNELTQAQAELAQIPFSLRAILDVEYEETVACSETRAFIDQQLQEDVSTALGIDKHRVEVLCYTRGLGTMAELTISAAPGIIDDNLVSCKSLAEQLQMQISDAKSEIRVGPAGKKIQEIEIHGPIAAQTLRAVRSAILELSSDLERTRQEVESGLCERDEAAAKYRAAIKREMQSKQEVVDDCESRLRAMTEDCQAQLSITREQQTGPALDEREAELRKLLAELEAAASRKERESNEKIAELEHERNAVEDELKSCLDRLYALEEKSVHASDSVRQAEEKVRLAEQGSSKHEQVCQQVDKLLVPVLKSCLTTANNIESEFKFFLAQSQQALAASHSDQDSLLPSSQVCRSMDCLNKDMSTLRLQLEVLSRLSYGSCEVFLQELPVALIQLNPE